MKQNRVTGQFIFYMLTLLAVLVMLMVIFGFSAENAVLSSERSGSITMRILDAASRWFHIKISQSAARGWQEILETPLRKSAHFMEYALLSYLVNWHMLAAKMYKEPDFFIKNRKQAITILKRKLCLGIFEQGLNRSLGMICTIICKKCYRCVCHSYFFCGNVICLPISIQNSLVISPS